MKKRSKFVAAVAAFAMVAGTSALAQTQPQNSDAAAHDHQHGSQTTQQCVFHGIVNSISPKRDRGFTKA